MTAVAKRSVCLTDSLDASRALLRRVRPTSISGSVVAVQGLMVEVDGLPDLLAVGDRLHLQTRDGRPIPGEVTGFRSGLAQIMAFTTLDGLGPGAKAEILTPCHGMLDVAPSWLGRVIDPLGNPLDDRGILLGGARPRPTRISPPEATSRARVGPRIDLG